LKGNHLPHVDKYTIPFDTIPEYKNKALMVYEFDAGDVIESYIYPAMSRSFREAGFQWATQFAYDPMATAYANTEYQTHYVNLAYTPSKAISLMIASKAFQKLPRLKNYGVYPRDSIFDVFRVSYKESLSEMNDVEEFYYSNSSTTTPKDLRKLKQIAGVGNSPVIKYEGKGAYFLDKLEQGVWRLEVMPDAIIIRDPYEKASPKKEVSRIQWQANKIQINLTDLGENFDIKGIDKGNDLKVTTKKGEFEVSPGTYILTKPGKEKHKWNGESKIGNFSLKEFIAPKPANQEPFVVHQPEFEISSGIPFKIKTQIAGLTGNEKVTLFLNTSTGIWKNLDMQKTSSYNYEAEIPEEAINPGIIQYRIVILKDKDHFSFPGNLKGDPFAWDNFHSDFWKVFVANPSGDLEIFNAARDKHIIPFPNVWKTYSSNFITGRRSGQVIHQFVVNEFTKDNLIGWQHYFGDKVTGRSIELKEFTNLVVRIRSGSSDQLKVNVGLIDKDATSYKAAINITNEFQDIRIPINDLQKGSGILLPRPYPGFQPLTFISDKTGNLDLINAEKLEISLIKDGPMQDGKPVIIEVESVWLEK
jgi:hypothetical protein